MDHLNIFSSELIKSVGEAVGSVYHPPVPASNDESVYGLDGIVSTIYLKGDIIGKISFFIRTSGAAKIVAGMLGVDELEEDSGDVVDGIGEVLNILTGCFKKHLEPHQLKVEISIPSTRMTGLMPAGRMENNIEQVYTSRDVAFKVSLSYRFVIKKEKVSLSPPSAQVKLKLSAADLLKQILSKKK